MWRLIIVLVVLVVALYYISLMLHLFGFIKLTDRLGFTPWYIIPFWMWFEKSKSFNQNSV